MCPLLNFKWMFPFNCPAALLGKRYYHLCFIEGETEAQRVPTPQLGSSRGHLEPGRPPESVSPPLRGHFCTKP